MKKKYLLKMILSLLIAIVLIVIFKNYIQKQCGKEVLEANSLSQVMDSQESREASDVSADVVAVAPSESTTNVVEQLQIEKNNTDIKATLAIENSSFLEPVVQTTDNDYYLTHDITKQQNKLGAIYADYRVNLDTSRKILIFGHSSTKNNVPFNYLENYYDEQFYHNHPYIILETKTNHYRYEIFSVYVETNDFTYMNMDFQTEEEWYYHLLTLQEKSLYPTNVTIEKEDHILIMQTCSNHTDYQKYSKKYLLIVSRRV